MRHLLVSTLMSLVVASPSIAGALLFNSGAPNGLNGLSIVGDPPNEVASAARFTTSAPWQIESVRFWSLEQGGYVWDGTIDYFVFEDVAGIPASVAFAQGAASNIFQSPDDAGACCGSTSAFQYNFDFAVPIDLESNTPYWLALQIGRGNDSGQTFWATTDLTPITATAYSINATFDNWILSPQSGGLAFQLRGAVIPAPPAWLALGLTLIPGRRGRRRGGRLTARRGPTRLR